MYQALCSALEVWGCKRQFPTPKQLSVQNKKKKRAQVKNTVGDKVSQLSVAGTQRTVERGSSRFSQADKGGGALAWLYSFMEVYESAIAAIMLYKKSLPSL